MSEVKVNKISPRTNCGTVTLGDSGDTFSIPAGVTLTNSGTATGFGPTGAVSWNTTKITADPNPAVSGVGYFADTTSAAFTVTLPAAPSAGDIVALSDYTGTWGTNNITVGRNSSNINGAAEDLVLNADNTTATLIYVDGTEGWRVIDTGSLLEVNNPQYVAATGGTITTCGDFKIHSFTGPGTFTVTCAGNSGGSNKADVLIVAGGGGGAGNLAGGGGGGGLVLIASTNNSALSATAYPISIGGGGAPGGTNSNGGAGTNSTGFSLTAVGGGGGTTAGGTPTAGAPGGSGGGAAGGNSPVIGLGGAATQPTQPGNSGTYGFGNAGGNRTPTGQAFNGGGAGGGGGNSVGSNMPGTGPGGPGGSGKDVTPIFGAAPQPFYIANSPNTGPSSGGIFAGGGGAGANPGTGGTGGPGGGGNGGPPAFGGTTNTGGGGGGGAGGCGFGAGGGSGIVLIRYKFQ
jgi:hypothetical protein